LQFGEIVLPPPFIPSLKGEGDFDIPFYLVISISSTKFKEENPMFESPSPLRGGIEGGGKTQHGYLETLLRVF
jgi:hypothetical protein